MSLFDLQDVCIAIGSIATLDLPMVVDLIGIYGLKGPYCTLTTTNWFFQALSVIPRGSWGDVARRSYHDPLGKSGIVIPEPQWLWKYWIRDSRTDTQLNVLSARRGFRGVRLPKSQQGSNRGFPLLRGKTVILHWTLAAALPPLYKPSPPPPCAVAAATRLRWKIVSGQFDEENPFMLISSVLLVQADEGVSFLVVDRIGDIYRNLPRRADVIVTTVGARHKCQQAFTHTQLTHTHYWNAWLINQAKELAIKLNERLVTRILRNGLDVNAHKIFLIRQSGPRPDPRLLRQTALEVLTRSVRSDSPRKTRPEQIPAKLAATAAAAAAREEKGGRRVFCLGKSHFPKSSSRAQHIELSIRVGISNPVLV
ncbi:putative disease resistance protein [Dorcoceras hygrometricum]|uniref:Putative disease resistance protein n=1 Tax=Dorcoceras hygrometricum TaxID=472368 RepID=A0A2Z7BSN8_9LAMI|nr:putative disease resistance protein [Dorcoceras hygrometricum]